MTFATAAERIAYAAGREDGIREMLECVAAVDAAGRKSATSPMQRLGDDIAAVPDPAMLHVLRPVDWSDAISPQQAAGRARVSASTIRSWVEQFAIGRRIGGRVWISRTALDLFLNDDARGLRAYLFGRQAA